MRQSILKILSSKERKSKCLFRFRDSKRKKISWKRILGRRNKKLWFSRLWKHLELLLPNSLRKLRQNCMIRKNRIALKRLSIRSRSHLWRWLNRSMNQTGLIRLLLSTNTVGFVYWCWKASLNYFWTTDNFAVKIVWINIVNLGRFHNRVLFTVRFLRLSKGSKIIWKPGRIKSNLKLSRLRPKFSERELLGDSLWRSKERSLILK